MSEKNRRLVVMEEILEATDKMLSNLGSAEEIVIGIESRQMLMDEYDLLDSSDELDPLSQKEISEIRRIAKIILDKDNVINEALTKYQKETKEDIADNVRQQKVLSNINRTNVAQPSSSGNLMDVKM